MLDFNRAHHSETPLSLAINELIAQAEPPEENVRQYLGASAIGGECLRKIQFDWLCDSVHPTRLRDIFVRGHFFEEVSRQHLLRAGFRFAPAERLRFRAVQGLLRGHADGILLEGPDCLMSAIPASGSTSVSAAKAGARSSATAWKRRSRTTPRKSGSTRLISIVTEHPALFTATNADTCERLHLLLPFDAELAQAMSDRAVSVIEATRAGELLPRITDDANDWRCKMCGHRERCWRPA